MHAYLTRGQALERAGRAIEAVAAYRKFVKLAGSREPDDIQFARERIAALTGH
jgi:hypothetical protein